MQRCHDEVEKRVGRADAYGGNAKTKKPAALEYWFSGLFHVNPSNPLHIGTPPMEAQYGRS